MNDEEFQRYLAKRLDYIDRTLTKLQVKVGMIEAKSAFIGGAISLVVAGVVSYLLRN
jgi:hypothetical protein